MYKGKKISLVLPAFNEEQSIKQVINEFKSLKIIDEIIVIDNNSKDATYKFAKSTGATVIKEKKQGYGFALRRGMKEASGEYIILCEPDGTFDPKDTFKLLSHIENVDMVQGTRTYKNYIQMGANLGILLRIGNIAVAKIMQMIYRTNKLTDCGCTFRILTNSHVKKILPFLKVGKSHFLPELVILTALAKKHIFEIPVRYKKRVGSSKITGSFRKTIFVALQMLYIIFKYKLKSIT